MSPSAAERASQSLPPQSIAPQSQRPSAFRRRADLDGVRDIFISYAREDSAGFARALFAAFESTTDGAGVPRTAWFDLENIPKGENFEQRIRDGISACHHFIYVMTPSSARSRYCGLELEWALALGKHVIPVLHRDVAPSQLPSEVRALNWIVPRAQGDESAAQEVLRDLLPMLESEYESYIWQHSALTMAARSWEADDRPTRLLLVGDERRRAEQWLQKVFQPPKQPPVRPTTLQCEFLCEGRKNAEQLLTDVFLCAAPEDRELCTSLKISLTRYLITSFTDTDADRPGREAEQAALEGLERADNLLFLLSKASVASPLCLQQLERARALNKRVIPLLVQSVPRAEWPEPLRALRPVDFTDNTTTAHYDRDIADLRNELAEDRDYYREHKLLSVHALRWQRRQQTLAATPRAFLLRGHALERAQAWVEVHGQVDRERASLTELQRQYVAESARSNQTGVDVFLSYSRKDGDFARVLCERLKDSGRTTWFDQESIAAGADYQTEIFRGIDEADNIVFVISPDSVTSPHCESEVGRALAQGKRIQTVLCRPTDVSVVPQSLARIQWIDCTAPDWAAQFPELLVALDIDRGHAAQHTVLQGRAREWEDHQRDEALLLNRVACEAASAWLVNAYEKGPLPEPSQGNEPLGSHSQQLGLFLGVPKKKPHPTQLQLDYVARSREAIARESLRQRQNTKLLTKRLQRFRLAFGGALVALACAGLFFWNAKQSEAKAEKSKAEAISSAKQAKRNELSAVENADHAKAAQEEAERQRKTAQSEGLRAETNAQLAESERSRAETQRDQARVNNLAFVSNDAIDKGDLSRALAVAAVAYELPGGAQAPSVQQVLSQSFAQLRFGMGGLYKQVFRHDASVDVAEVSADGRLVLTAAADGSVKLWDREGKLLRSVEHGARVKAAAFLGHGGARAPAAGGASFVTVGYENLAKIWQDGAQRPTELGGHECGQWGGCAVVDVAVSPSGRTLVTVGADSQVRVWDAKGGLVASGLEHQARGGWLSFAAFSPGEKYFLTAAGDWDHTAQVYGPQGEHLGGTSAELDCPEKQHWDCRVTKPQFSPVDPQRWLAGFPDRIIRAYDSPAQLVREYPAKHGARINAVAYHPRADRFVSTDAAGKVLIWKIDGSEPIELNAHQGPVTALAVSSDGEHFATGGEDTLVNLWRFDGSVASHFRGHGAPIRSLQFTPNGKGLLSSSADRTARLWRVDPMALPEVHHDKGVAFATFLPNGTRMLTVEAPGGKEPGITARLWEARGESSNGETGYVLRRSYEEMGPDPHGNFMLYSLDVSPDGRRFLTASTDYKVRLWDVEQETPLRVWEDSSGANASGWRGVRVARYSREGRFFATGDFGGTLRMCDAEGNPLIELQRAHSNPILTLDFAPGARRLVTGDEAGEVRLWRIEGGKFVLERTLAKHQGKANSVRFDGGGQRVLSAGDDSRLLVTDLSGARLAKAAHDDRVFWAEFSERDGSIVSASADRTAVVWDANLRRIRTLEGHKEPVTSARFGADGTVLTASRDGRARVWFAPPKISSWLKARGSEVYQLSCSDRQELGLSPERCH